MRITILLTALVLSLTTFTYAQRLLPVLIDEANLHLPNQFPEELSGLSHLASINGGLKVIHDFSNDEVQVFDLVDDTLIPDDAYTYEFGEASRNVRIQQIDSLTFILGRANSSADQANSIKVRYHNGATWSILGQVPLAWSMDIVRYNNEWLICGRPLEGQSAIYRWDGEEWHPFENVFTQDVRCMAVYEGQLYVGGIFVEAGGAPGNRIAKLTDDGWEPVGQGVNNDVNVFTIYNNQLLIGGRFTALADESQTLDRLALLSGGEFQPVGWSVEAPLSTVSRLTWAGNRLLVSSGGYAGPASQSFHIENNLYYPHEGYAQTALAYVFPTYYSSIAGSSAWYAYYRHSKLFRERADGRTHETLQNSEIIADFMAFASQFNRPYLSAGFTTTQGSDFDNGFEVGLVYNAGFWYAGIANDEVHGAHTMFNNPWNTPEAIASTYGPYSECYDRGYLNRYYRVWRLTRGMIETHQAHYADPNYTMPEVIQNYPGNGRSWCNESSLLAPFEDLNNNGIYEPEQGEYPIIHGDKSVITLSNDRMQQNDMTPGIEIVSEYFMFDTDDEDIAHTVFLHAQIRNRSGRDYEDFAVGYFVDPDIGNPFNDYLGSNPAQNYFYGYNGSPFDEPTVSSPGYGHNTPALGCKFLNRELNGFMHFFNAVTMPTSMPTQPEHVHNFLFSRWNDGSPLLEGGLGVSSISWVPPTPATHHYPNFPWDESEGAWSEVTAENIPQSRRGFGSTHIHSFPDRSAICLDLALVAAFPADSMELYNEVAQLDARMPLVEAFYHSLNIDCQWENLPISVEEHTDKTSAVLHIFPNPSSGVLTIQTDVLNAHFTIFDLTGRMKAQGSLRSDKNTIDLSELPNGLYLCQVTSDNGHIATQRFILSR